MSSKTIKEAVLYGEKKIKETGTKSANLDAEILLCYVLGVSKEKLIINSKDNVKEKHFQKYCQLIKKRAKHIPVAYLTGRKEFYNMDFYIDRNVLVPRPETEMLVDEILKTPNIQYSIFNILELGTGSGCAALTLAKYLPKSHITATDISKKALRVAKKNQRMLDIKNIKFKKSNLLSEFKNSHHRKWTEKPDIILANLPYLDDNLKNLLDSSESKALKHEPKIALMGGPDGTDIYKRMFGQIKEKEWTNITIFIEIGEDQVSILKKIIKKDFPKAKVEVKKDLAKKNRVLIIKT